jgi:hypothetical protein
MGNRLNRVIEFTFPLFKRIRVIEVILAISLTCLVLFSVFRVRPRPFDEQPFPDVQETADGARQLVAGNGYVTYVHNNERHPPRYPPGYSLALAPFAAINNNYPSNVEIGAKFYAGLYVLATVITAWLIGGPNAASLTALFIGISPFAREEAKLIMSDAFAAGGTVILSALLYRPSKARVSWAGGLAGTLVLVRLAMALNLPALLISLPRVFRKRLVIFAAPPLGALGLYNWLTFGSPFKDGYSYWLPGLKSFAWSFALHHPQGEGPGVIGDFLKGSLFQWACPCPIGGPQAALSNIWFYPAVLLGLFWIYAVPLVTIFGVLYIWKHREETFVKFALGVIVLNLIFFTFFFYQGARFMAGPATLLTIFAAVYLANQMGNQISSLRERLTKSDLNT